MLLLLFIQIFLHGNDIDVTASQKIYQASSLLNLAMLQCCRNAYNDSLFISSQEDLVILSHIHGISIYSIQFKHILLDVTIIPLSIGKSFDFFLKENIKISISHDDQEVSFNLPLDLLVGFQYIQLAYNGHHSTLAPFFLTKICNFREKVINSTFFFGSRYSLVRGGFNW